MFKALNCIHQSYAHPMYRVIYRKTHKSWSKKMSKNLCTLQSPTVQVRTFATKRKTATNNASGKTNALSMAIAQIESSFGKGSIMRMGDRGQANVDTISTGSLTLDVALGIGGLPRGRIVEIYGPESSGKTTLALHVVAEAQKAGLAATFIDVEHAIDPIYAKNLGVDVEQLYLSQPDAGEHALEITDTLVRSGAMDVVVLDSVAALVPRAELEGDMGDQHMALQARLMSQALRKLNASLARSNTLIIFINQIRSKVGVLFGSPDVTSGGNALKYYASVRMEIRRTGQIKQGTDIVGNTTRVKVVKNKLAPPFRQAEFDMTYGTGISKASELVELGVAYGLLKKSGAWYSMADSAEPFAQGKEKAKSYLLENQDVMEQIEKTLREKMQQETTENNLDSIGSKLSLSTSIESDHSTVGEFGGGEDDMTSGDDSTDTEEESHV